MSRPEIEDGSTRPAGARVRVGVAGWDYPDWSGFVYPAPRDGAADRLRWISRFIDVVEINSSFYRPVSPRTAESWVSRTVDREGFTFTAKSHRSWTHEPPDDLDEAITATLTGLGPLRDAGKLGALLIQFPQSFHFGPEACARLERIVDRLAGWRPVIEVRHSSWERESAADWFAAHEAGWCWIDQPRVGSATVKPLVRVSGSVAYMRLHGRNAANWFRPDAGRDARYDYLYSMSQLEAICGAARDMAGRAEELFVIQNNHFRGQALVNALQMKKLLQGGAPRAPEELVTAYPELAPLVSVERHRLF